MLWWKVAESDRLHASDRLHTKIEGRFVTIFYYKGALSCIDSICHHAGGPLTKGEIRDIEELSISVVSCPWHKFLVGIKGGEKVYQSVEIKSGVPVNTGWKVGNKMVQRSHIVKQTERGIFVSLVLMEPGTTETCVSDGDASSQLCGNAFDLHTPAENVRLATQEEIELL